MTDEAEAQRKVREFEAAPDAIQRAFWRELGEHVAGEQEFERWWIEVNDDEPHAPEYPRKPLRPKVTWDETWSRRAVAAKRMVVHGKKPQWMHDPSWDPMLEVPVEVYVEALSGADVSQGKTHCPLPDHEDESPSFWVYPERQSWFCWGCNRGGGIYQFAALHWSVISGFEKLRGEQFKEVKRQLWEMFA